MDLGAILSAPGAVAPATATPLLRPQATPWAGYQAAILAQSKLPAPPPADPRSFPVPHPYRPNLTKPNGITATPAVTPLPGPANAARIPTSPTARPASSPGTIKTPFTDYRGTTMGSESGHLATVKGFTA